MTKRFLLATIFCSFFALFFQASAQTFSAAERGIAVFYADYLEGQPTAYGEVYHRNELTAAHRNYPSGTLLKVSRLDNQRSVIVRVNDRGAFCDGCVVDLSKVAALQLDMLKTGKAMVSVEVVGKKDAAIAAGNVQSPSAYDNTVYNQPVNQHSTYPRPDVGFQGGNRTTAPGTTYPADQPVNYGNSSNLQARTPASYDQQSINYSTTTSNNQLQAKGGLNGYEQIKTFDSYNYYQAQAAKQQAVSSYDNGSTDNATYERLRARGLLPEEKAPAEYDAAAFNARGNIQRPSNYDQNSEPVVTTKGGANPSAYIQWTNTPTSTARPQEYSSESSFPQKYSTKGGSAQGNYAIQMASYRNFDNAQRQLKKVKELGLKDAYLLETSIGGSPLYKIMNGPFGNKEVATNELGRYKRDYLLDGIVVMLR